ncbi:MAG: type III-B CRISPR module RAMP protein Cmr1 [Fimbriimonadales bacterium]|nr:type III-B CRISPR module RAMP protein Cmr1 [Fimbriimonadales bacterium]
MRRDFRAAPSWQEPEKREAIEVQLRLITPMFGGGYKSREVDPFMPIRPAAIRGHLRFWWRATAGAQYASAAELYKAETAIWGGAALKEQAAYGRVAIEVFVERQGTPAPYADIAPKATPKEGPLHGYFLFPFQAQQDGTPAAVGRKDAVFRLRLLLDSTLTEVQKTEIRNALKAWIAFGGVGARTRRGCGALKVVGNNATEWLPPETPQKMGEWLRGLLPKQTATQPIALPTLAGVRCGIARGGHDATSVWRELGRFWARFRKGHFKEPYQPMKGAKWGDYRQVLCRLNAQQPPLQLAKPFLGLPIIYQRIKDAKNLCFVGSIEPVDSGRMASPVILKPVALSGGQIVGLIAVLPAQPPRHIQIKQEGKEQARQYAVRFPEKDPVLKELEARGVAAAVMRASELHFGGQWTRIL